MPKELLEDIGEKELINRLGKFMPKNQVSDDCALIKTKNESLLVNTDSLVENVHFNEISICPQDLGWKAVVSNISDLLSSGSKKTFRAGESVQQAILEKSNLQHTYVESGDYVFMDMTSFEETRLTSEQIGKGAKYLKEGMEVNVIFHSGKVLEVELPISITLKVTETDPGVKGDTASGGTKPAILETGAQVMVPLFISVGEMIKVDTRNDSYLGREN